jgi:xanthine dehydrogenase molybdenum-binding subunit
LSTTVVPAPERALTVLRLDEDGRVTLATGSCDCGTGSSHALAALAAGVLALEPNTVDVVEGDSALLVMDLGSFAQRTVYVAGRSVLDTAWTLRNRIQNAAAARLGCSAERLSLAGGAVVDEAGQALIDLAALARLEALDGRALTVMGGAGGGPAAIPLSYAVVVVTVDVHTGEGSLAVPDALIVADCGTVIDRGRVRSQLEGAFVQGLSATLCERWVADPLGQGPRTLLEHGALGPGQLPALTVITLDSPEPTGPGGAKGVGELGLPAVAPAVANAVCAAIGHRVTRIPIARGDLVFGHTGP